MRHDLCVISFCDGSNFFAWNQTAKGTDIWTNVFGSLSLERQFKFLNFDEPLSCGDGDVGWRISPVIISRAASNPCSFNVTQATAVSSGVNRNTASWNHGNLIRALDSYQALTEAMAAKLWYGVGVTRNSMMVCGKERPEQINWAVLDENKNRGLIYMEEELGSTHYYDRDGRPFKIVSPQGNIYLYKGECISTELDELQTEAEIAASRWLHDEGGAMDNQAFWRAYYEHTARAALSE